MIWENLWEKVFYSATYQPQKSCENHAENLTFNIFQRSLTVLQVILDIEIAGSCGHDSAKLTPAADVRSDTVDL